MYRKLFYLVSFVLVLSAVLTSVAKAVDPDLVGWWRLDEGSGTTAADMSGNGNDGTLQGDTTWVTGQIGKALQFDGVDDFVQVPHAEILTMDNEVTVMAWINTERYEAPNGDAWQGILSKSESPRSYSFYTEASHALHFSTAGYGGLSTPDVPLNEWVHVCAMVIGGAHQYYINGEDAGTNGSGITLPGTSDTATFVIGRTNEGVNRSFLGMIDDVRVYRRGLTQEEVQVAMLGEGLLVAFSPDPENGGLHPDTWVTLSWKAGDFAVSHDVYMGDNFDDVNDGLGDTFQGNQGDLYFVAGFPGYPYPDGLVPGTTYYWRIDEVNDLHPDSPWKGEVWNFTVPSKKAYGPSPDNGAEFITPDIELSWTRGLGSKLNYIYLGESFDEVDAAAGGLPLVFPNYTPSALEPGKTYYWRVDQFDGVTTHKGDVWSFETLPDIPISDPDLLGWWKLDEGAGLNAVDWSGHGNHGTLMNGANWVEAYDGGGVEFDQRDDYIDTDFTTDLTIWTISAWVISPDEPSDRTNTGPIHRESNFQINWDHTDPVYRGAAAVNAGGWFAASFGPLQADTWYHLAATYDGDELVAYKNGILVNSNPGPTGDPAAESATLKLGRHAVAGQYFGGIIDDVRVYSKVLTIEEIQQTMRGDPYVAWNANPSNGATPFIRDVLPLTWSAGDNASEHDVYFGTDKDAVDDADTTTADIYRGRQAGTSYSPPEGVEWGGGPYYWRIDQVTTDGTITKGRIWSFAVADNIPIDDFEAYNSGDNQIWFAWHDGLGAGALGTPGYIPGNGTGSAVGDETTASYTEETIIHGGRQSMPLVYDNNKQGYSKYSETELTLTAPRDWTLEDVSELSLWFRGYPASVGSFVEGPAGTYTMTASGFDIWFNADNVEADEFHFAYKTLTGAGSIVARVESVENTHVWAKAGVMIRQTLDPDSAHGMMVVTPGSGVSFQRRPGTGQTSLDTTTGSITTPYWVKLERSISGTFTASHSANGSTWTVQGTEPISMGANVYIGLAVTSHDAALTCQAVFTNVTTTGNVTGQWLNQDVGISSNAAEPLYVAVSNAAGAPAVVVHDDPAATTIDTWTEWVIPLQALADQGIILTNVDRIAIGLGTRGNMTVPGGSGKMYFDDIRLYRPRETAE